MDNYVVKWPLTKGKFATLDIDDLNKVACYKWQARFSKGNWYAIHSTLEGEVTMHGLLMGSKPDCEVDHINQNGLDNRRVNLRFATKSENRANVKKRTDNSSGFKGVSFNKRVAKWRAYIQKDKKQIHLGFFDDKQKAAKAYNDAAKRLFGEFAWLNQIH